MQGGVQSPYNSFYLVAKKQYTYSLKYDGNGENVTSVPSVQEETTANGVAVFKVTGSKPVRPGYIFQGWAESADAAEVKYAAGDEIRIAVKEENQRKTLYAVWKSAMVGPQEDRDQCIRRVHGFQPGKRLLRRRVKQEDGDRNVPE